MCSPLIFPTDAWGIYGLTDAFPTPVASTQVGLSVQSSLLCLHTGFLLGSPTGTRIERVTEPQTWPVLVSDPRTGLLPVNDFSGLFTDEGDAFLGMRQQLLIHCCYLQGSKLPY